MTIFEILRGIWGLGGFAIDRKWLWDSNRPISTQTKPSGFISNDFNDFHDFGIVFGGLTLVPEGPRTLRECPEGPGTL